MTAGSLNTPTLDNPAVARRGAHDTTWNNEGPRGYVYAERLFFHENQGVAANGWDSTYTGVVNLPKGAVLVDIIVYAEALWDDGTSASLQIGDHDADGDALDADGYFTSVDLKATDLTAQQTIRLSGNLATAGGVGGAYTNVGTNTHLTDLYYPDGGQIRAVVTAGGGDGTAGKTHVVVVFAVASAPKTVEGTST